MKKLSLKDIPAKDVLLQQQRWTENNKKCGWPYYADSPDYVKDFPFTYEAFPQWPEKLVFKKMEKLSDEGYLEYGVSLRTAWLTEKGKKYLKDVE